jgi:hypothetical protein
MTKERQRLIEGVINGVFLFNMWDGKKSLVKVVKHAGDDCDLTRAEITEVLTSGDLMCSNEHLAKWRKAA